MLFDFVARGVACSFVVKRCVERWFGGRWFGGVFVVEQWLLRCVERFVVVMFGVQLMQRVFVFVPFGIILQGLMNC